MENNTSSLVRSEGSEEQETLYDNYKACELCETLREIPEGIVCRECWDKFAYRTEPLVQTKITENFNPHKIIRYKYELPCSFCGGETELREVSAGSLANYPRSETIFDCKNSKCDGTVYIELTTKD